MKKKVFALLLCAVLLLACSACGAMEKAAELDEYEIGGETVKTVKAVVGQRTVTGVETGTKNGVKTKSYTYESDTAFDDLRLYAHYLQEEAGYMLIEDMDLNVSPGSTQLAVVSKDEGQVVIVRLDYDTAKGVYVVTLVKGEGTLTIE